MSIWTRIRDSLSAIGESVAGFLQRLTRKTPPEKTIGFTIGMIALGAKMAKADGVVTMDEVNAFKEVFKVPDGEMKNVARVFNLAKQDMAGYEAYAEQLSTMFKGNRKVLEDVLEGLFHIAKADEALHPREEQFLSGVATRFGMTETEFAYVKARHVAAAKRNPYDVLGVKPSIANASSRATTGGWSPKAILTS